MGKLLEIREKLENQGKEPEFTLDGTLGNALQALVEAITSRILKDLDLVARQNRADLQDVTNGVASDFGVVHELIGRQADELLKAVGNIETLDEVKDLIKSIRIPNNAHQLNRIEQAIKAGKVNLSPVMKKLEDLKSELPAPAEMPQPAREWRFEVERDPETRLITQVHAIGD